MISICSYDEQNQNSSLYLQNFFTFSLVIIIIINEREKETFELGSPNHNGFILSCQM